MKFVVKITNGDLNFGSPHNRFRWQDFLKANEGKWLHIDKPQENRSSQQNSYYWVYLDIISHETGNAADDLHFFFKDRFLAKKEIVIWGKKNNFRLEAPPSTTKLNKVEFGEYLKAIEHLTEIPLPDPKLMGYYTK